MEYKTPGVYVEEIAKLPLSVAAVETAIPAFIGYTEKAQKLDPGDLAGIATEINSVLEYEEKFGRGPSTNVTQVNINENNAFTSADMSRVNFLYDSIRMFYANGGGKCIIVSIGDYDDSNDQADYIAALTTLEKVDLPTLILFPDLIKVSSGFYNVQKAALAHCAKLQDRFCVFDLLEEEVENPSFGWKEGYEAFRDNIGVNNLNYGAAYTPHLFSNLGITLNYRDLRNTALGTDKIFRGGIVKDLRDLTESSETQTILDNLRIAIDDNDRIRSEINAIDPGGIREEFLARVDLFRSINNNGNYEDIFNLIYELVETIDGWIPAVGNTELDNADIITDAIDLVNNTLGTSVAELVALDKGARDTFGGTTYHEFENFTFNATEWGIVFNVPDPPAAGFGVAPNAAPFVGADNSEMRLNALPNLLDLFEQVYGAFTSLVSSSQIHESEGEEALFNTHTVYRALITALRNKTTKLPPSGTVVGLYAKTDSERGVFKAPANVSINGANGLSHVIDKPEQDVLNVDPVSGKSINAIRPFTGKGILIWGARTLAGNDNEWRYVPVRRFFIFAEESIKKATEQFVFEPNDANTWTKIKAMIANFLTVQWRAGALAGAKPDHAFYVKIGLGDTMTALDILEGRMIVEIGMAVVRPAEFIILRFTHKMQES